MNEENTKKGVKSEAALREEEILKFWKDKNIFKKTLKKESPKGEFVFYEGPPTANGRPGIHHVEARSFKDAIPRYKTMRGFHVDRKAGWDTHGLPVELEVEKELGISSKPEIERYGIAKFNELCKKNVWKYVDEWHDFTERMGYWVDMDNAYVTYASPYIESVWWVMKEIAEKDLLYKDYKVVPWCSRCGTALSTHELAQGYADVKDLSVTAKFKIKGEDNSFILAWTTTPWTLPGNVALAVGPEIDYVQVEKKNESGVEERFILAKNRLTAVFPERDASIIKEQKGSNLVGLEYEPLYSYLRERLPESEKERAANAFKVHPADFVTTEDGTGVVHTAVMYGQDDFELGTKVNLPKFHMVTETGNFIPETGFFSNRFVKDEELAIDIIKDLAHRGLLFKKEKYEHSYPHCWRCKTPLIYYARDSWYIKTSSVRDELLKENEKINWEPDYIKEGRFGEWLSNIRDWAISRERYWGTPLPIWMSEDGSNFEVVGSVDELKKKLSAKNEYFVMRHGRATHNESNILSGDKSDKHHVTEAGKSEVVEQLNTIKEEGIDLIITSPLLRTTETAELARVALGLPEDAVVIDERLREPEWGEMNGKNVSEYHAFYKNIREKFVKAPPGGENLMEVKRRLGEMLYEMEGQYEGKKILLVTHEYPAWLLFAIKEGAGIEETVKLRGDLEDFINCGDIVPLQFVPLPHNGDFELDLHRPYIDEVVWRKDGLLMKRVPEVMDVWFDSGAMPYAQSHYPFENKEKFENGGFPADYISEAIDQTRGWFYTMHAIGVLLGKGAAYKNVICLGHILDKEGLKMSKSKGNTVSPWEMADKYGIDVLRFWMYSINQPGESKNFDEKTVEEVSRKVFNPLLNSLSFYKLYSDESIKQEKKESTNTLDKWILSELKSLEKNVTEGLDSYRLLEPSRAIRDFIGEQFSQWYVRRSRDRFKEKGSEDYISAVSTLGDVLKRISILLAPFAPFTAEHVYREIGGEKESVHLESWPEVSLLSSDDLINTSLMSETRRLASLALEARSRGQMKVRQPLQSLQVKNELLKDHQDHIEILMDEVNVKEIKFYPFQEEEVILDLNLTPALLEEGEVRDIIRDLQSERKNQELNPQDIRKLLLGSSFAKKDTVIKNWEEIKKPTNLSDVIVDGFEGDGFKISL